MDKNVKPEFTISYQFDAPKKLVFNAFSKMSSLNEWWGPVGSKTRGIKLEFKKGGVFHYKMTDDGGVKYGLFRFSEIKPYDLLEFTNSFADAQGKVMPAPFDIALPLEIFYRLVFSEANGKTTITLTGKAVNATSAEIETLISIRSSMEEGFAATFNSLTNFLKKEHS